jgi:hypothetical protein
MHNEKMIEFIERVNYSNPIGFKRILNKYGATGILEPQDAEESIEAMQLLINEYGNVVVNDLLKVHPDRNLFASFYNGGSMKNSNPFRNINMSTGFPTGFYFDTQGNSNTGTSIPQQEPIMDENLDYDIQPQIAMQQSGSFASQKIDKLEKEIASTRRLLTYFAIGAALVLILK